MSISKKNIKVGKIISWIIVAIVIFMLFTTIGLCVLNYKYHFKTFDVNYIPTHETATAENVADEL